MPTSPLRRLRRLTARDRTHWVVVLILVAITIAVTMRAEQRSSLARGAWGPSTPVVVARSAIAPGDPLDDVELRRVPSSLVPDAALRAVDTRPARRHLTAGQIVTELDVSTATTPPDHRALLVPLPSHPTPPSPGSEVELMIWTAVDPYEGIGQPPTLVRATFLEASQDAWLIAASSADAAIVAAALVNGTIVPLLLATN